ncbi:bifunctional 2-polyprenyl-6-hydroxyphenol methylase/3-demethylubiquinol 3-O-methyltransferase UbiG [Holospora curviuscula]|uniref:Ubiquinone biosynthesis O-methyltransferase n=1 Tax=Holospora curviuscula TaxID=1082868 RepID=A0A2S5R7Y4_9PROT|nr:bifunctional 2-polyprenyl-6-hydroxyphenol methylase/3-demethylubiquinol 3-O-methyltransferase UbiG [Holospora curviuscula]PPE03292.1 Ubiquinone biosynthesis O-methyltransferase [Holospora curviuscula]
MFKNWWDLRGPAQILHQLSPLRITFLESFFSIEGRKILDVGCGGGIFSEALWRRGARVSGTDVCKDSLKQARFHAENTKANIIYESPEYFQGRPNYFEVLLFMEVLEHVDHLYDTVAYWFPLLIPGGYIMGSTVNRTTKSYFKSIIAAEYILQWIPSGTHNWHHFIQPKELKTLFKRLGCFGWVEQGYRYSLFSTEKWTFCAATDTNFFFSIRKL